jgi:hypothetical protein
MLWRKAWLGCRYRFLLCYFMSFSVLLVVLVKPASDWKIAAIGSAGDAEAKTFRLVFALMGALVAPVGALILAGSGINTQTNWGMLHGFHPSMHFLLSLPVRRERLLRVRVAMGLGLLAVWLVSTLAALFGVSGGFGGRLDAWRVLATLPNLAVATLLYFSISVFLSSFLDEYWAGMTALAFIGGFAGYGIAEGPGIVNLLAYSMQQGLANGETKAWLYGAVYLALSLGFYWAAWRVVEKKEY